MIVYTTLQGKKVCLEDIEVDGINTGDYPDFCDAYICDCLVDGEPATDEQLEEINEDGELVYDCVLEKIY